MTEAHMELAAADPAFLESVLSLLTPERRALFETVLNGRTRHVCAVLENLTDPHNTSAVIRSCECFGIQDVHVISDDTFRASKRILQGAGKWVDIIRYPGRGAAHPGQCLEVLKARGYRIAAAVPAGDAVAVEELPLDRPVAVCLGQEHAGISAAVRDHADLLFTIPMFGFTESFNVSVAAGVVFHTLTRRLRAAGVPWQLPEDEKNLLRLKWALRCVKRPGALLRAYLANRAVVPGGESRS